MEPDWTTGCLLRHTVWESKNVLTKNKFVNNNNNHYFWNFLKIILLF